jgi:hypothetical protein
MSDFEWKKSPGNEDEHYKGEIQPVKFGKSWNLPFTLQNMLKYICRHHNKGKKLDLEKVVWYAEYEMSSRWDSPCIDVEDFIEDQELGEKEAEIVRKIISYHSSGSSKHLEDAIYLVDEIIEEEYKE